MEPDEPILSSVAKDRSVHAVPDYTTSLSRTTVNVKAREADRVSGTHPLEEMAKLERARNDIYAKLGEDEILITNLPTELTASLESPAAIKDFLIKNVHKDLQVKDVEFVNALSIKDAEDKTAFIRV